MANPQIRHSRSYDELSDLGAPPAYSENPGDSAAEINEVELHQVDDDFRAEKPDSDKGPPSQSHGDEIEIDCKRVDSGRVTAGEGAYAPQFQGVDINLVTHRTEPPRRIFTSACGACVVLFYMAASVAGITSFRSWYGGFYIERFPSRGNAATIDAQFLFYFHRVEYTNLLDELDGASQSQDLSHDELVDDWEELTGSNNGLDAEWLRLARICEISMLTVLVIALALNLSTAMSLVLNRRHSDRKRFRITRRLALGSLLFTMVFAAGALLSGGMVISSMVAATIRGNESEYMYEVQVVPAGGFPYIIFRLAVLLQCGVTYVIKRKTRDPEISNTCCKTFWC